MDTPQWNMSDLSGYCPLVRNTKMGTRTSETGQGRGYDVFTEPKNRIHAMRVVFIPPVSDYNEKREERCYHSTWGQDYPFYDRACRNSLTFQYDDYFLQVYLTHYPGALIPSHTFLSREQVLRILVNHKLYRETGSL